MQRVKSLVLAGMLVFVGAGAASAETIVYGRDADIFKAMAIADYKAAQKAIETNRCVAYYASFGRCTQQYGVFECRAGASKHRGSCPKHAIEWAREDLRSIVGEWGPGIAAWATGY